MFLVVEYMVGIESDVSVKLKPKPSWTIFNLFSVRIFWWHLVHSEYPLWVSWHLPFTQASDWNVLPHLWYIIFVTMCHARWCYKLGSVIVQPIKGGGEGGTVNVHWIMIIYREAGRRATMIARLLSWIWSGRENIPSLYLLVLIL